MKRLICIALVGLLWGVSCNTGEQSSIEVPGAPVILISIDTLRSDRLPAYGYAEVRTPAIDSLIDDAVLFERAYSHYPLTLPSHVSVLTGLLPDRHGVRDNLGYTFESSDLPFLPRALRLQGYATGAAVSSYVLRGETGISSDFDFFDDDIFFREWVPGGALSRRGGETLEAIRPWLRSVADRPFFLFFHIYEPHTPYEAPEPFASQYLLPYDAEVAAADAVIGELLEDLKSLRVYDDSIIVLMSDHGEGLGEHGEVEHGVLLYRESIQVPLILKLPAQRMAGSKVSTPAQLIDIFPTIQKILGIPQNEELAGISLLELGEEHNDRPIYAESFYARIHYGWSDLASIVRGRYHYIHGPEPRLFDLLNDFTELDSVLRDERPTFAALRDEVNTYQRALRAPAPVDEEIRLKLAALGYLDVNFGDTVGPLPDPQARLATLSDLWAAFDLRKEGKPGEALAAARRALAENPEMGDAWQILGSSLEDLGRYEEALEAFTEALNRMGPRSDVILAAARVRLELGQIDQALEGIRYAREVGVVNPVALRQIGLHLGELGLVSESMDLLTEMANDGTPESLVALARVKSEANLQQDGIEILQGVLSSDEENAKAHETFSLIYLRLGEWALAKEHAERALQIDAELSQAWNNLGAALHFQGEQRQALDAWEKAIELDGKEFDAMFNLGLRAAALGETQRSRSALEQFVDSAPAQKYGEDIQTANEILQRLPG